MNLPKQDRILPPTINYFFLSYSNIGQDMEEVVFFFLDGIQSRGQVCVRDENGQRIPVQFSPTWTTEGFVRLEKYFMEVSFLTRLPALSVTKFTVHLCTEK